MSQAPQRAVDASMHLLNDLVATSVDPDYARVAARGRPQNRRWLVALVMVLAGALVGTSLLQEARATPAAQRERSQLISRVKQGQADNDALTRQLEQARADVRRLQQQALSGDPSGAAQLENLEVLDGSVAVTGPGLVVTVDDAPALSSQQTVVVDQDLRQLVNGLWGAGAEAVAVNGHRLTARTAIRGAGSAITVDYVSLNAPYVVEAIGDPRTMPARLQESPGGQWWAFLKSNYGLRYDVATSTRLTLPPDPGLGTRLATPAR